MRRPHYLWMGGLQHNKKKFLGWVKEVRTMNLSSNCLLVHYYFTACHCTAFLMQIALNWLESQSTFRLKHYHSKKYIATLLQLH
jgi:hypothetical protein